jgi:hypothetical protein
VSVQAGKRPPSYIAAFITNRVDPAIVLGDDVFDGFGDAIPVGLLVLVAGVGAAALIAVITFVRRGRLSETGPTLRQ